MRGHVLNAVYDFIFGKSMKHNSFREHFINTPFVQTPQKIKSWLTKKTLPEIVMHLSDIYPYNKTEHKV